MYRVCRMTGEPTGRKEQPHLGDGLLVRRVVEVIGETEDRKLAAQLALATAFQKGPGRTLAWVDTVGPWLDVVARWHVSLTQRGQFVAGIFKPRFYRVHEPHAGIVRLCSWDSVVAREYAESWGDGCYVHDCYERPRLIGGYWQAPTERTWWYREGVWTMQGVANGQVQAKLPSEMAMAAGH